LVVLFFTISNFRAAPASSSRSRNLRGWNRLSNTLKRCSMPLSEFYAFGLRKNKQRNKMEIRHVQKLVQPVRPTQERPQRGAGCLGREDGGCAKDNGRTSQPWKEQDEAAGRYMRLAAHMPDRHVRSPPQQAPVSGPFTVADLVTVYWRDGGIYPRKTFGVPSRT